MGHYITATSWLQSLTVNKITSLKELSTLVFLFLLSHTLEEFEKSTEAEI